ncbi:MAG TPA: UbiD family decarboxylase [Mycobacterium sp.]|nr:UbiD family decarboxylase [Mycobacterium sp.]HUH70358.1 UbiD family decarboxylase [Mycobacterium sp.]
MSVPTTAPDAHHVPHQGLASAAMSQSPPDGQPLYRDIRDYLAELERRGLLIRVERLTNKDTEVMPLVRWQFRGLDQSQRKGWLFENLTDSRGRRFDASVAVAIAGASPQVYAAALGLASPDQINLKWLDALSHPLAPVEVGVDRAPVKEVVITGQNLVASGGIDMFPVTVTNPGTDVSAYFSCPVWITRDPQTGVYNVGTYRVMVKAPDRAGVMMLYGQDSRIHWQKARQLGRPLEAVLCLSPVPALALCSATKLRQPEYEVAGALNGAPLELVPAETVDLLIPATAEIAIEGRFRTDVLEMEGPFGEYGGYTGTQDYQLLFELTAITHRRQPVLQAFISEMPPSESSCIRKFGFEGVLWLELSKRVPHFAGVNFFEFAGSSQVLAVALKREHDRGESWMALRLAGSAVNMSGMKWIVAVDDDIDITDLESVFWAMAWRVQPHRDIQIMRGRPTDLDPSAAPVAASFTERAYPEGLGGSQILIDATIKWPYPPVSLPTREHMERARRIWEDELGLPTLRPRRPWFGYPLGYWPESWDRATKAAVAGRYLETGQEFAALRTKSSYFETGTVEPPDAEAPQQ